MIEQLRTSGRLHETLFLGVSSLLCFGFSLFRVAWSDSLMFLFLNWNLFLAFVPWCLTTLVHLKPQLAEKRRNLLLLIGSWLLFFPNAPYILTDLFHLHNTHSMPIWFDLILVLSFAWVGLLFGLFSLLDIEQLLHTRFGPRIAFALTTGFLFLAGFGIYLGRFLRWNSWDVLHRPTALLSDIGERVLYPTEHAKTWGVTLFMGLFLNLAYQSLKLLYRRQQPLGS